MNRLCKILGLVGIVSACDVEAGPQKPSNEDKMISTLTEQDAVLPDGRRINRVTRFETVGSSTRIISIATYEGIYSVSIIGDASSVPKTYENIHVPPYMYGLKGLVF